jgi:hypothetical protein
MFIALGLRRLVVMEGPSVDSIVVAVLQLHEATLLPGKGRRPGRESGLKPFERPSLIY